MLRYISQTIGKPHSGSGIGIRWS